MKLLLFDIDGTLLHAGGQGRKAIEESLADLTGCAISTEDISFSGKTDPQILREVLVRNDCPDAFLNGRFAEALSTFETVSSERFDPGQVNLYEGVLPLLRALDNRSDVQLALLTGNLERLAFLKLEAVGLDAHFPFGAFGSDHEHRHALPSVAVERARAHAGRDFTGKNVVIIGDTEHDIRCGRDLGVFAVAVSTGSYSRDDLARHDPDLLLDDLRDTAGFLETVLND